VKRCYGKCRRELPVECFRKNRSKPDGLHDECKDCCRERAKTARERLRTTEPEKYKAQQRAKRVRQRETRRAQKLKWAARHKAEIKEKAKRRQQANPEKYRLLRRAAKRRFREKFPERYRAIMRAKERRRMARMKAERPELYRTIKRNAKRRRLERMKKERPDEYKRYRQKHLLKKYGLTDTEFMAMIMKQRHKCRACNEPFDMERKGGIMLTPVIDHDHNHDGPVKVRGIIHHRCNVILGFAKDNHDFLERLANYLRINAESLFGAT
jgi:hypothetical protein